MQQIQEEIFPLVDENGNITGQATRSKCHDGSKLLHPVIHLHIFNEENKLFLQKRSKKKDIFPNLWDSSVGGHIDLGETPLQASVREAWEELGLKNLEIHYITKHIIETDFERELTFCYYAISKEIPRPDEDEVSDGCFWDIELIKKNMYKGIFTPNFELDFELFLSKGLDDLTS